jgi:hypothetical protein
MIDLHNESLLSLDQAAKRLPAGRRGRPVSLSCVLRWILDGVVTPHGLVRLEGIRMGGRWLTSVEALERFARAQTPSVGDRPALPRMVKIRRKDAEGALAELSKAEG